MNEESLKKMIEQTVKDTLKKELKGPLFASRKVTDTPTDSLMVVNRRYVNLNGTTSNRPISSVATTGQKYFDTTIGRPIYWNGTNWVDGAGSIS